MYKNKYLPIRGITGLTRIMLWIKKAISPKI